MLNDGLHKGFGNFGKADFLINLSIKLSAFHLLSIRVICPTSLQRTQHAEFLNGFLIVQVFDSWSYMMATLCQCEFGVTVHSSAKTHFIPLGALVAVW